VVAEVGIVAVTSMLTVAVPWPVAAQIKIYSPINKSISNRRICEFEEDSPPLLKMSPSGQESAEP
jgi:hypothetical protein